MMTDRQLVEDRLSTGTIIGQVLLLAAGAVLLLSGVLAMVKAGLGDDLAVPVVSVFGFTHTAWLGIIEAVVGALLLVGGMSPSTRDLGLFLGVLLLVAGVVILADAEGMPRSLAIEKSYGWFVIAVGAAALVGGLMPGGVVRRWYATRGAGPLPPAA